MDDMNGDPYTRIYHKLADEFPEVYDGPDLAGYVRLLIAADQAWPTSARWAGYVTRPTLDRLVATGLILVDGLRYRIKGMDKEREARSESASNAARSRWGNATRNADGNATRNAETMPSRAEPSQTEPSLARGPDAFEVFQQVTGSWPTKGTVVSWLSSLVDEYAEADVCDALVFVAGQDPTRTTLLGRVRDHLASEAHRRSKEAEEARARAEDEYQRRERERVDGMSAEERAATEARWKALKPQLGGLLKEMS
jgi:hypothetical protein